MRFLILFTLSSLLLGCGNSEKPTPKVIRPITWVKVETVAMSQVRRLSGSLQAVEAANLSFQVGGKVAQVYVNLGDKVVRNTPLAMLDKTNYQLNVKGAEAQLQKANSSLTEARNEFERYQELMRKDLVSKSGFDNAKAAYETAQSAVQVAETQLNIAQKDFEDTVLKSPYDGTIIKRLIEPSQQVAAGQTVLEIEGEHGLEVQVLVPENLIQQISKDAVLEVRFPANRELKLQAKINEIGVQAVTANSFPVTLSLIQQDERLRAGMTAEVDFTFEGEGIGGYRGSIVKLPVTALGAGEGQHSFVFVYDAAQKVVHKRDVTTVNLLNNEVLISEGLKDGEIVATAGVSFLREGQEVTLLDPNTQRFN